MWGAYCILWKALLGINIQEKLAAQRKSMIGKNLIVTDPLVPWNGGWNQFIDFLFTVGCLQADEGEQRGWFSADIDQRNSLSQRNRPSISRKISATGHKNLLVDFDGWWNRVPESCMYSVLVVVRTGRIEELDCVVVQSWRSSHINPWLGRGAAD